MPWIPLGTSIRKLGSSYANKQVKDESIDEPLNSCGVKSLTEKQCNDDKFEKSLVKLKKHVSIKRFSCPTELILLHCPKCSESTRKPARKRAGNCERCDSQLLLQCSKCRKIFRKYITLYCHIKAICGNERGEADGAGCDGRVACSECSTRFSSYENLRRHKRLTCRKQPEFKCSSCPFVSRYKASLEQHERSQHLNDGGRELHRCSWCRKRFKHAQTLKRHEIYSCGKEKGFFCGHCDYKCYLKYQLKSHMRTKHGGLFSLGSAKI